MAVKPRRIIVEVEGTVNWRAARDPDTDTWIGVCDELNLNAIGDTWQEMLECAGQAMATLLADLNATGELGTFLRSRSWKVQSHIEPEPDADVYYDMPFNVQRVTSPRGLAAVRG